jgi:hypothetical protein
MVFQKKKKISRIGYKGYRAGVRHPKKEMTHRRVSRTYLEREKIWSVMYACVALHNMTVEDKGLAICPHYE